MRRAVPCRPLASTSKTDLSTTNRLSQFTRVQAPQRLDRLVQMLAADPDTFCDPRQLNNRNRANQKTREDRRATRQAAPNHAASIHLRGIVWLLGDKRIGSISWTISNTQSEPVL